MVEAVMFWNEPNNMSHWDAEVDPGWTLFAQMVSTAAAAVQAEAPRVTRVLGGISPIDPAFVTNLQGQGALERMDAIAVHGFPLDWNHWQIHQWPERLDTIGRSPICPSGSPRWASPPSAPRKYRRSA
jgi:beta-xylosidase